MDARQFQFEWDDAKAATNLRRHGVLASTIFAEPALLTVPDLEHNGDQERWLSIGLANDGKMLTACDLWTEAEPPITKIRIISPPRDIDRDSSVRGMRMSEQPVNNTGMPAEVDFSKGLRLSELLTDVLKRDIEINEALK